MNAFAKVDIENKSLFSVFQPIYSFSNQACIGVEALIRGVDKTTGMQISVEDCLAVPEGMQPPKFNAHLNDIHLRNWQSSRLPNTWLFLNLDIQAVTKIEDLCIEPLIKNLNMHGREIVVEVVESEIHDEVLFQKIITQLRRLGCLIALDDFGAGHSNIDRIWKAQPDIVKLDRGVLLEAMKSLRSQNTLRNLTKLIKQSGSICLLEGIETQEQALLAMEVGVDLVQGFYFARPRQLLDHVERGQDCIREVTEKYPAYVAEQKFIKNIQRKGYETLFEDFQSSESIDELEKRMQKVMTLSFVKRFFILDTHGVQVSEEHSLEDLESRVDFMSKGKGLCWKNRRYFIQAKNFPAEIYVSEPYRSLIDMELCLTISKAVVLGSQTYVACFDVYYHDKSIETVQISI